MSRRNGRLAVLAALLLAGFAAPAAAQSGNPAHDRLVNMPLPAQRDALRGLLTDALAARGGTTEAACPVLGGVYMAGLDGGRVTWWDLRCRGGATWRMGIAPDGRVAEVVACPRLVGTCFVPVAGTALDPRAVAEARCNAACELQSGSARQACFARCMEGTESIAAAGAPGRERHVVIFVAELPDLPEGIVVGGLDLATARTRARLACEAVSGGAVACREAIAVANRCAAVAWSQPGGLHTGSGLELDDAETAARSSCPEGSSCEIVVSGC